MGKEEEEARSWAGHWHTMALRVILQLYSSTLTLIGRRKRSWEGKRGILYSTLLFVVWFSLTVQRIKVRSLLLKCQTTHKEEDEKLFKNLQTEKKTTRRGGGK